MKKRKKVRKAKKEIKLIAKKYGFKVLSMSVREREGEYTLSPHLVLNYKTISS